MLSLFTREWLDISVIVTFAIAPNKWKDGNVDMVVKHMWEFVNGIQHDFLNKMWKKDEKIMHDELDLIVVELANIWIHKSRLLKVFFSIKNLFVYYYPLRILRPCLFTSEQALNLTNSELAFNSDRLAGGGEGLSEPEVLFECTYERIRCCVESERIEW
ncbi:hypothetical protein QVD17_39679 [Tagetes erecta]|uniref:Uncharacterized protein n=1 Tax=Tagetes erecta TaxID=13708 RepID=A0AAD8NHE4_TARER|nr:hypothetical protein QVD17_39679 [Tagetes erecta]